MRRWRAPGLTSAWRVLLLSCVCALTSPAVAADNGTGVDTPPAVSAPALTDAEPEPHEPAPGGRREDLTVFFAVGILIDLLLLTLFFVWARRQWRKTRR